MDESSNNPSRSTTEQPGGDTLHGLSLDREALLRIAADGELDLLSNEQRRQAEALLAQPENAAFVADERAFRSTSARAFSDVGVPSETLRRGVEDRLRGDLVPASVGGQTRKQGFWLRGVATLAAAAAVAIVATTIFSGPPSSTGGGQFAGDPLMALRGRVATFVSREHEKCEMNLRHASSKQRVVAAGDLPELVRDVMGRDLALESLVFSDGVGVSFVRAGKCGVPGGASVHLSFDAASGSTSGPVSLFVQRDDGSLGLELGKTYTFGSACDDEGPAVYLWGDGTMIYYLVTDEPAGCTKLLQDRAAPDEMVELSA
ncbi:MAG: hypothetical protein AAF108_10580 [Planctomycetota bacterium]